MHDNRTKRPTLADTDAVFYALAHETRRQLVVMLAHRGDELPSGFLASQFAASWPTITRHLKVLEDAGVVEVRREGRGANYRLVRERVTLVLGTWLDHLEPVDPERTWTSRGPKTTKSLADKATKQRG